MATLQSLSYVIAELEQGLPPAPDAGFLGVNLAPEEARLILIPVPWEATTSYGGGTSEAPQAIIPASHQLDMEDGAFGQPYRSGITFVEADETIRQLNEPSRQAALKVIAAMEQKSEAPVALAQVNQASEKVNERVYQTAREHLKKQKFVAVVGGDHACPEGLLKALADDHDQFGVLHFDAHHDLRKAYEGFEHSHASIFYNVMETIPQVSKLVQVGIRDYSRDERLYAVALGERAKVFYGRDLFRMKADGLGYKQIADEIITALPHKVYISFDIDALDPPYCPSTGTPVPGGLSFDEACYIFEELAASGRQVIGFDLCEVTPGTDDDEWDANVGARILYKLCGCLLRSQGLC